MNTEDLKPFGTILFSPKTKVLEKYQKEYGKLWYVFGQREIFDGHGKFYLISSSPSFWVTKNKGCSCWVLEGKDIDVVQLFLNDDTEEDDGP